MFSIYIIFAFLTCTFVLFRNFAFLFPYDQYNELFCRSTAARSSPDMFSFSHLLSAPSRLPFLIFLSLFRFFLLFPHPFLLFLDLTLIFKKNIFFQSYSNSSQQNGESDLSGPVSFRDYFFEQKDQERNQKTERRGNKEETKYWQGIRPGNSTSSEWRNQKFGSPTSYSSHSEWLALAVSGIHNIIGFREKICSN